MSPSAAARNRPRPTHPLGMRWRLRGSLVSPDLDPAIALNLAQELGVPPLVARILAARGLHAAAEVQDFLRPSLAQLHSPFELLGMEAAVVRIERALRDHEPMLVYGDYDVDGISGTATLLLTLRELGADADYYIPNRLSEGYGLNCEALEQVAAQGTRLVISVDCGITAVREAVRARELGLDLIITDHHQPGDELPECCAVINPRQPGCTYPFKGLAGAGVAFKLAHALLKRCHPDAERAKEFLKELLDIVTLGTVADIVPLIGENRALVAHGLTRLRACKRPGLAELFECASMPREKCDTTQIGFVIGPRLNAAGRTEHAKYGVELLLAATREQARPLANHLEQFNRNRRSIEQDILAQALTQAEEQVAARAGDRVVVLAGTGWHHGVLGIVASRVLSRMYRPTIVIGIEEENAEGICIGKGSGRSIDGFDLHAALHHCSELLVQFGGHTMAAGMTIEATNIDAFRAAMEAYAMENLTEEDLRPLLEIDAHVSADELTIEAARHLEMLAPYGHHNPRPVVACEDFNLVEEPRLMKDRHLRLRLSTPRGQGLTAVGWNMADRLPELAECRGPIKVAGGLLINDWNGRVNVEMELKDFQLVG